ncbi:MAG: alpha/beta hydrolase [Methylococcales bacterium]
MKHSFLCHTRLYCLLLLVAFSVLTGCQNASPEEQLSDNNTVLSADGTAIHYQSAGSSKTTLLFIHCWSCDISYWDNQFDLFSKYFRVVRLDLAGHGKSSSNRKNYTIPAFAQDVEAVISKLKLDKVILIGHSIGGSIAVQTALNVPEKINGVIAVDSFETGFKWPKTDQEIAAATKPFEEDFSKTTARLVRSMFKPTADPGLVNKIAQDMSAAPPAVGNSAFKELLDWIANYSTAKASLKVPLYHINAKPDQPITINDHIIYLENVGHFIPQAAPAGFNGAMEQTVAKILGL